MRLLTREWLDSYMADDSVARLLNQADKGDGQESVMFTSQRWLRDTPAKRLAYHVLYGDLLDAEAPRRRVLDMGGGFSSLSRLMLQRHDYWLVETNSHDRAADLRIMQGRHGSFWLDSDWYALDNLGPQDLVIANDLFPNVDQRLALFLERFVPHSREIRLSLTFYNHPRFYPTRRVDADEMLWMLAWDGDQTRRALEPYLDRIIEPDLDLLTQSGPSLFPNGRQVCVLRLRGVLDGKDE